MKSKLLQKIDDLTCVGYEVSFLMDMGRLRIDLRKKFEGTTHMDTSVLPLDNHHFNDDRICSCLDFMQKRLTKKIAEL